MNVYNFDSETTDLNDPQLVEAAYQIRFRQSSRPEAYIRTKAKAANVPEEDPKSVPSRKTGSLTSHYSSPRISHLIEAANNVSATDSPGPVQPILKRRIG